LESGAQINLKSEFEFGPCVVRGLRNLARFFSDPTQTTVGGGFRNPDIRQYDVHRKGDDYRLVIHFDEVPLHAEFDIRNPAVHIDEKFLKAYDGQ
jgi:hypothetical protein